MVAMVAVATAAVAMLIGIVVWSSRKRERQRIALGIQRHQTNNYAINLNAFLQKRTVRSFELDVGH
jgi:Flp pilus assembly protein TadB